MLSIYVAAPYSDAPLVRGVHKELRRAGCKPTSQWAEDAKGAENLELPLGDLRRLAMGNDDAIRESDRMLVLAREGAGGEMFSEVRYAITFAVPVYWVGRTILSAFRPGVARYADLADAIAAVTKPDFWRDTPWAKGGYA
jgi:hypothetical protein